MKSNVCCIVLIRLSTFIILLTFALIFLLALVCHVATTFITYNHLATVIVSFRSSGGRINSKQYQHNSISFEEEMNFNFTCDAVVRGEENAVRIAKKWQYQSEFKNASQLLDLMDDCSTFKSRFSFPSVTLSAEEADFPLAYGLIVYKNPEQVVRMLSSIYWPQNLYCITYDTKSTQLFKDILNKLPKCFPNVLIPKEKYKIDWCGYGVLQASMSCLEVLTASREVKWRYFQYMSGSDLPLKTNLEMVRIFKALNGSFNSEISQFQKWRIMKISAPPPGNLTIFKSSFSATFSRESAEVIVNNNISREFFEWLNGSYCPDETFWTTVAGNPEIIKMPGGFPGERWLEEKLNHANQTKEDNLYYVSRYQVWPNTPSLCLGSWSSGSCVFGVDDLPAISNRKELVIHKLYMDYQPAAYFCLLEMQRQRTIFPIPVDAHFYSNLAGPRHVRANGKYTSFWPDNF